MKILKYKDKKKVAELVGEVEFFSELYSDEISFPFKKVRRKPLDHSGNYSLLPGDKGSWATFQCRSRKDIQEFCERMSQKGFKARGFALKDAQVYIDHVLVYSDSCAE